MLERNKALDIAKNININQEKTKKIVKNSLDSIKNNSLFQDFSNTWNSFSEKKKKIYIMMVIVHSLWYDQWKRI